MTPSIPKRYEVRSLLGEGGSGRVYRVQDSIRDRELALKLVTPAESAFLRREFDTLRQIRHENLIQVFDWCVLPSGEAYYTMELIEGGDWSKRMGEPQSSDEVRRVLTGLLRGLAHLHCHGEIHGDLKPGNILLGAGGVVKITDTGMGGGGGSGSGLSGTPGYAAPEVWEGAPADVRSDLYSVGVMSYEALTGKHPFAGHTVREVISGQLEGWVPSPGVHGGKIPADLERVVMRALERQPGLRQGSADEFMEGFGVEDRIGEILGGKLVGREKEIAEIEMLLHSEEPGTPTLLYITGEPGVGKTALMEEVSDRASSVGLRTVRIATTSEHAILESLADLSPGAFGGDRTKSVADFATTLRENSNSHGLLLWIDAAADAMGTEAWVRSLCRVLWAISIEAKEPCRSLFVITLNEQPDKGESFERRLILSPFSQGETAQLFQSVLGVARLEDELVSKVQSLTGGNPGATRSCITSLVDRAIIARRDGVWSFRETEQIQDLSLPTDANPWTLAWGHLAGAEQEVLVALALAPRLNSRDIARVLGGMAGLENLVARLEAKGWLRVRADELAVASQSIRQVAITQAGLSARGKIASSLLSDESALGREDRASLALEYRARPETLDEGIWASEEAGKRGEHRVAERRLKACLDLAKSSGDHNRACSVAIKLAETLHQLGEDFLAAGCLNRDYPWQVGRPSRVDLARRAKVLGTIESSQGNMDEARQYFLSAAKLAEEADDTSLALESHAALAELEWRHESEAVRSEAVSRMRGILETHAGKTNGGDEQANLTYQLGAALVVSGEFSQAREVLGKAIELDCSDYWRMRLANALASGVYYEGDFNAALKWVNDAWQSAERAGADSFKARILNSRAGVFYGLGRPRDAVDQHRLATFWARRNGSPFEYLTACEGLSINLILLARYEEAIAEAVESGKAAVRIGDLGEQARGFELEALANYHLGDYEAAGHLVERGLGLLHGRGYDRVKPRLDWLKARLLIKNERFPEAEELLKAAESVLLGTRDWEDLPGVQIEMHLLRSKVEKSTAVLADLRRLTDAAAHRGVLLVELQGAIAIAEIVLKNRLYHTELRAQIASALGRADDAGVIETSWWLTYCLGEIALQRGDHREAHTRFRRAIHVLDQIAGDLTPAHKEIYLKRPHARLALDRISSLGG
jgi:serine/threonine protein kinase/tetratricopeptide (TPR) repeat protein